MGAQPEHAQASSWRRPESGARGPVKPSVTDWRPYADRWHPHELRCACGVDKPPLAHPKGWYRRYHPKERRTEVKCPACIRMVLPMRKRVKIAISVDSHFVSMLKATCNLDPRMSAQIRGEGAELTAAGVLALVALGEAQGALPEQVHAMIPPTWRPHIEAVSEDRVVTELPD